MDVLVDTNVILRRVDRSHSQYKLARLALAKLAGRDDRLCVTSQNLFEAWSVLTRPMTNNGLGLTPGQADRVLTRIEAAVFRLPDDDAVYTEWRKLVVARGVSGKESHDARLVAAMTVHGISHLLTFNVHDFARYPMISIIDAGSSA